MEPRWRGGRLSAEQVADLRTELGRLAAALAVAFPAGSAEEEGQQTEDVAAEAHDGKGSAHTSSSAPLSDPLAEEAAALLLKPFEEMHLSGYRLGDATLTSPSLPDLSSFLSVVSRHTRLRVLDLSFNSLTPQVLAPLLQAIRGLPLLAVLKLSGNMLGSARSDDDNDSRSEKWDLSTVNVDEELGDAATAAARLGRYLATNPALLELALFHCDLNDHDVRELLSGLVHPRNTTLHTLQLSWNPACTSRSAVIALQLVTDLGNTTLCKLELEGVAPATQVRLEYACTADGVFRSGHTLIPESAWAGSATGDGDGDGDNSGNTGTVSTSAAGADVVSLEQLRQQQQLAEIQKHLTPAQGARFMNRCRYLAEDLDGSRVLAPLVMRELEAVLSTRLPPKPRVDEHHGASELNVAAFAERETASASAAAAGAHNQDGSGELFMPAATGDCGGSDPHSGRAAPSPVAAANSSAGHQRRFFEAVADMTDGHAASVAPPPQATDAPRPRTSPPMHLRRRWLTPVVSTGSVASPASGRHAARQRQHPRTPQELRDARFETPQRLAAVMADAEAFRRRLQPVQLDTRAPPCAGVSRYRSGAHSASATKTRSLWYADDGFVLRPNGLSKVLVAPVLPGGATAFANVALEDVEDRTLQPCWCTPRQTSPMTGIYAGTLHYHCVHEATTQQQKRQYGTSSSPPPSTAATAGKPADPNASKSRLPLLLSQPLQQPQPQPQQPPSTAEMYCGCQGTGHLCLSACVASEEAGAGRRRDRMRSTLHVKAAKSVGKSAGSGYGASASRKPDRTRERLLNWTATNSDAVNTLLSTVAAAAPPALSRSTVRTTCGGLSIALNYNPVTHFSAPHVSCAAGMTLAEF
ncbi:conserved hypothetical protein [Leishmania major strain Friedlin]|uniref:Leucine-rich repeat protein n=1 Tax=Leishmania major TaxID=5664 RepID=Q4QJD7_LEIMA|nr:conserved hypothetical protein [Leishmania major strain Friedlin]CAG9568245.1 hypothetical_protein_-_conserved [Leishmania major strain Friedlin]CAJ01985.1 conserved hypothetical protein [Leishmania major strain Friedlin]|eukprot:XP_001687542.1 conserved hypothetical protein [Leishmania major strain Friedlin]